MIRRKPSSQSRPHAREPLLAGLGAIVIDVDTITPDEAVARAIDGLG